MTEKEVGELIVRLKDWASPLYEIQKGETPDIQHDIKCAADEIERQMTVIKGYARIYNDSMRALRETVAEREQLTARLEYDASCESFPLPEPFSIEEAILHGDDCPKYTARDMQQAVAAERERWRKWACLKEWDNVNDPPCHPGDKDWRPCENCAGPNHKLTGASPV